MVGGLEPPAEDEEARADAAKHQGVIFVLEGASLETAKVGKGYQLLNCDDHATFLRKHNKDPALYRPDIAHQALLAILDSPLAKSGRLKVQINPQVRLPRTFKRFCGLLVQLLQKLSIRATNGPDKLLKVIKGPVTKHLPAGCRRVGFSRAAPNLVQFRDYVRALPDDAPAIFVVGAMAHGQLEAPYIDEWVAVSEFPLSAACCLGRITNALEDKWGVV